MICSSVCRARFMGRIGMPLSRPILNPALANRREKLGGVFESKTATLRQSPIYPQRDYARESSRPNVHTINYVCLTAQRQAPPGPFLAQDGTNLCSVLRGKVALDTQRLAPGLSKRCRGRDYRLRSARLSNEREHEEQWTNPTLSTSLILRGQAERRSIGYV